MKSVLKRTAGSIVTYNNLSALLVRSFQPDPGDGDLVPLRFAFVVRGSGDHIFPAFLLDDWGREIRGLRLYEWVREHGERFPRGEIFGFEQDGRETQCFLRELELYARLPTYAYESVRQPVNEGLLISAVLIREVSVQTPQQISKPRGMGRPLRSALVNWWQIPATAELTDLSFLQAKPDPGY